MKPTKGSERLRHWKQLKELRNRPMKTSVTSKPTMTKGWKSWKSKTMNLDKNAWQAG